MAAISETLRQARLRSGVDLDRLAAKTKINPRYLEAIEAGEFEKLPSGIFARMFIKQYADAVGLDGALFAEEFARSSQFGDYSGPDLGSVVAARTSFQPAVPSFHSSGDNGRTDRFTSMLSSLIWVVAAILVCAAVYYGLAHLPSRSVTTTTASAAQHPAETAPPASPKDTAPKTLEALPPAAGDSSSAVPSLPSGKSVSTPEPTTPATVPATAEAPAPIQLALSVTEPVWVTAIADGKKVLAETVAPGSPKTIAASKSARLTLGNAGGVDITFNGKKLEPFGPRGQVRTVDFTSWGAQVVSRTPPNPDPLPDPLR